MAKRKRPHTPVAPHVVCWLERRKKAIPAALRAADGPAAACLADLPRVLALLPDLRERERRALARHVDKCMREDSGGNDDGDSAPAGSDGEYERGDDPAGAVHPPPGWPARVEFSNEYRWAVPADVRGKYRPADGAARRRAARPSRRVCVRRIEDPDHPAYPERGMYCALPHAPPGTWLLDYVGHVTSGEDQDARSDYVSDFGERGELSCDAASYGNEARFLNDVSLLPSWALARASSPSPRLTARPASGRARSSGTPAGTQTWSSGCAATGAGSCARACTSGDDGRASTGCGGARSCSSRTARATGAAAWAT